MALFYHTLRARIKTERARPAQAGIPLLRGNVAVAGTVDGLNARARRPELRAQTADRLVDGMRGAEIRFVFPQNLQQLVAHTEETLLNTLETNRENDTDTIHFMNRSDVYEHLANSNITMQTLFGMTYLEKFLGVDKVFLSNRITPGTMVATPVSNLKSYCVDFGEIAQAGIEYQTDGSNLIGFAYSVAMDHVSAEVHAVRTLTITPEKEAFVVRGSMTHVA
jgi:hypothetical protein